MSILTSFPTTLRSLRRPTTGRLFIFTDGDTLAGMVKTRLLALGVLIIGMLIGYVVFPYWGIPSALDKQFRLGLDLSGGAHLLYAIDASQVPEEQRGDAYEGLRDAIEQRVNYFGVSEPVVQLEGSGDNTRLIIELAGVSNTQEAIALIGDVPFLEFRIESGLVPKEGEQVDPNLLFLPSGLDGKFIKNASVQFDQTTNEPTVSLNFNDEGAKLFEQVTAQQTGKRLAIFLDGQLISAPVVRERIPSGQAQISGGFAVDEARLLAQRLNAGALPLPISLLSQETVEASLGQAALKSTLFAGLMGAIAVIIFMIAWYRLPGLMAVLALGVYSVIVLALFKLIPVTLTAAGITGFILSIGMAVDANILIFERMKEELLNGKSIEGAMKEGFTRAWTSIRDSNVSSLITATILYWFGTSVVRGFALTLGIGILVSMFTAITISRLFLRSLGVSGSRTFRNLLLSGFNRVNVPQI